MSFVHFKFFFVGFSLLFAISHSLANCVDLSGTYQCDSRTSTRISQTTNSQGTTVYTVSSSKQLSLRYTADGRTLTQGNLIAVCNQNRLRIYSGHFGFLMDYELDAAGNLNMNAYNTRKGERNPDNISDEDLTPIPSSGRSCRRI